MATSPRSRRVYASARRFHTAKTLSRHRRQPPLSRNHRPELETLVELALGSGVFTTGLCEENIMAQIGEPVRRYTVIIPLNEPVSPTPERVSPPLPNKSPDPAPPATKPELTPVR